MTLLCHLATSTVLESAVEGEDKEKDGYEEKTASKPLVKEELEIPELKVETPELKVKERSYHQP